MIRIGSKQVGRAILNDLNVSGIYLGPKLVWGREVELLQMFKASVIADGGTYDEELFTSEFFRVYPTIRNEAIVLIVCGAYKAGVIYGINCITGQAVPFMFGRVGIGTYIDKNGILQSAGNNIPRINYDPVGLGLKGYLFENGVTQLISNSLLNGNTNGWVAVPDMIVNYNVGTAANGRPLNSLVRNSTTPSRYIRTNNNQSVANTTYSFRVIFRAGTSNKVSIGIGASVDPGGSNTAWGGADYTGFKLISGPATVTPQIGTAAGSFWIENLSENEDTIIEIYRRYIDPNITVAAYIYPDTAASTDIGASILFSTPQLEINALGVCTSQIDSNGSQVTRSADQLTSETDFVDNAASGFFVEGIMLSNGVSGNIMFRRNRLSSAQSSFFVYNNAPPNIVLMYDGTTTRAINNLAYYQSGMPFKASGSIGPSGMNFKVNGSPIVKGLYDGVFGNPGGPLICGSQAQSIGRVQNHLRVLAIMHRELSDAEHIALTQS